MQLYAHTLTLHTHPHTSHTPSHLTHTLTGIAGGSFGAGACLSAGIRDKDDHLNAAVGGALVGSVFGFKSELIILIKICFRSNPNYSPKADSVYLNVV